MHYIPVFKSKLARKSYTIGLMNIFVATTQYESWLRRQIPLDETALARKHAQMSRDAFRFLRATFYRWAQLWPLACPDLEQAPQVLSVGDLHLENFGLWRNLAGQLAWGVNDFDEAYRLPYTHDLTRLGASVWLGKDEDLLEIKFKDACTALLDGYIQGLRFGGQPFILENAPPWLQDLAEHSLARQEDYWEKLRDYPIALQDQVPAQALSLLETAIGKDTPYRLAQRSSGLGSLGKPRWFVQTTDAPPIAWEVKALTPSAWHWAHSRRRAARSYSGELLARAVRSPDAGMAVDGDWIVRHLSPERIKLDIEALRREKDEFHLLVAMGWETANIHLASAEAIPGVLEDLSRRPVDWLQQAAKELAQWIEKDWKTWKKKFPEPERED